METPRLAHAQLTALSNCLNEIYGQPTGDNPVPGILDAIERLVRINTMAANEMKSDWKTKLVRNTHHGARGYDDPKLISQVPMLTAKDHPLILHTLKHGRSPALRLTDFVSQRQMRELSLYSYLRRQMNWRDQIAISHATAGGTFAITINRDKVFRDEEVFLLRLLQPHLERVLNRCALFGKIPGSTQLTPREREVLYWITLGKKDEEIAIILRSSPRTVNAQVRSIFSKLGVENRAAAVAVIIGRR